MRSESGQFIPEEAASQEISNADFNEVTEFADRVQTKQEELEGGPEEFKPESRFAKYFNRGTRVLGLAMILGTLASEHISYQRNSYEVSENLSARQETVYNHEDKATTEVLEYLSGKAELPAHISRDLIASRIKTGFFGDNKELSASLDTASVDEMKEMLITFLKSADESKYNDVYKEYLEGDKTLEEFFYLSKKFEFNEDLYNNLWKLEKMVGNPKIRFYEGRDERGYYDSESNTICIPWIKLENPAAMAEFIEAESAHAYQYRKRPIKNLMLRFTQSLASLKFRLQGKTPFQAHSATYDVPYTLEHDAHQVVEPELRKVVGGASWIADFDPETKFNKPPA